jgi:hypothetical protein
MLVCVCSCVCVGVHTAYNVLRFYPSLARESNPHTHLIQTASTALRSYSTNENTEGTVLSSVQ